jgi:hypothetical protein
MESYDHNSHTMAYGTRDTEPDMYRRRYGTGEIPCETIF